MAEDVDKVQINRYTGFQESLIKKVYLKSQCTSTINEPHSLQSYSESHLDLFILTEINIESM